MNYYTADLHFGHSNVINFDHRPFIDVDEMDSTLIALWNNRVRNDDDVWILGVNRDGCMLYGYRPVRLNEIVKANRNQGHRIKYGITEAVRRMIYITGDTHGEFERFSTKRLRKQDMEPGEQD